MEAEGDTMITMTPAAISKVKAILSERKEETGLRIAIMGGGCSGFQYQMTLEKESGEGDDVLDIDGLKVYVDSRSVLYLKGTQIDYIEEENGSGFKFENPNAMDTCGCGDSFEA